jgi:hypothetical protein
MQTPRLRKWAEVGPIARVNCIQGGKNVSNPAAVLPRAKRPETLTNTVSKTV